MWRRRWLILFCGFIIIAYLVMIFVTNMALDIEGCGFGCDGSGSGIESEQYTLPSLEGIIQHTTDLDVQRVLKNLAQQNIQAPANTPPVRIIVSSTWRSGSTLLGEALASYPGTFYHYEPLMPLGMQQIGTSHPDKDENTNLLRDLLNCNYNQAHNYLKFAYVNHDMFVRNWRLWSMCSAMPRTKCYSVNTIQKLCSIFPLHVMKVVRARLEILEPLLADSKVKLIWLVRDPRAVINSRQTSVTWCQNRLCSDPKYLCSDLDQDYSTYLDLKENYPSKIMLLRYEDYAKNPYEKTREVLNFAGLDFHPDVRKYLNEHLNSNEDVPWSTKRDPRTRITRWTQIMSFEDLIKTQYHCQSIIKNLGYRLFKSRGEMLNGNAVGLLNVP